MDHCDELANMIGYYDRVNPLDGSKVRNINSKDIWDGFHGWKVAKANNIMTFRDQVCKSCYDDSVAPKPKVTWKDVVYSYKPYAKL